MTVSYTQNKEHIYKWRENNKEAYNSYMKEKCKEFYKKNAERQKKKQLQHYYAVREFEIFRKILL